jgi:spore coat protein CotH
MRNKIAMDLANELGIGLDTRFVDVWMNGEYRGNYLLTPKNDYAAPDGGYVLESDNYYEHGEGSDPQFQLPDMWEIGPITHDEGYYNRITVKDIGSKAEVNLSTIEEHFLKAWAAVRDYGSEDYQNYFDIDSWARMFLMYEVSKTYDCYAGSLHMHRDGLTDSDKLIAGPAWDYDASFGRTLHKFLVGVSEPIQLNAEGWYNDSIGLLAADAPVSILQELGKHASFMQHVAKVYNENKAAFEDIAANVDRQREVVRDSALMNNERWGTPSIGLY